MIPTPARSWRGNIDTSCLHRHCGGKVIELVAGFIDAVQHLGKLIRGQPESFSVLGLQSGGRVVADLLGSSVPTGSVNSTT